MRGVKLDPLATAPSITWRWVSFQDYAEDACVHVCMSAGMNDMLTCSFPTESFVSIRMRQYCEAYWDKANATADPNYWRKTYPIGQSDPSRFYTIPISGPGKPNPNRRAKPPAGSNKNN